MNATNNENRKRNMKNTLSTSELVNALLSDQYAKWSHQGAIALANHFEDLEAEGGFEMELDLVSIRCDYTEFSSLEQAAGDYIPEELLKELLEGCDEIEALQVIEDELREHGHVIEYDGGVILSMY